jgi:hypothetical protein
MSPLNHCNVHENKCQSTVLFQYQLLCLQYFTLKCSDIYFMLKIHNAKDVSYRWYFLCFCHGIYWRKKKLILQHSI